MNLFEVLFKKPFPLKYFSSHVQWSLGNLRNKFPQISPKVRELLQKLFWFKIFPTFLHSRPVKSSFDNPAENVSSKVRQVFAQLQKVIIHYFFSTKKQFCSKGSPGCVECFFNNLARRFSAKN